MVYVYQPTDTMGAFAQGFQFTDALRQRQAAQQKAEMEAQQKQQRQASLQQAIQGIKSNPTPQAFADFYLQFPEMEEQMKSYRSTLADGDKATLTGAAREAIVAQRTGQSPAPVYRRYAEAAKNSNRPDLAKQFEDAAAMAESSADGADLTARMFYQSIDPNGYKAIFEGQYDTAFLKELAAEGLEPGTPEYQAALKAKREGDPFIVVPGIGLFPKDQVMAAVEGQSIAPAIPEAAAKFLIQNPKLRDDFDKKYGPGAADRILGGTASNGGGSFR